MADWTPVTTVRRQRVATPLIALSRYPTKTRWRLNQPAVTWLTERSSGASELRVRLDVARDGSALSVCVDPHGVLHHPRAGSAAQNLQRLIPALHDIGSTLRLDLHPNGDRLVATLPRTADVVSTVSTAVRQTASPGSMPGVRSIDVSPGATVTTPANTRIVLAPDDHEVEMSLDLRQYADALTVEPEPGLAGQADAPGAAADPSGRPAVKPPPALSFASLVDAGISLDAQAAWHDESTRERYCWTPAELTGCPRAAILRRAGFPNDDRDRSVGLLLAQTSMLRSWMAQRAIPAFCGATGATIVCADGIHHHPASNDEAAPGDGHRHPTLALRATPDLLLRSSDGTLTLWKWKLQKEGAYTQRRERGARVDRDHTLQLAATALVLEGCGISDHIDHGIVAYLSRQEWWADSQPVTLTARLREAVADRITALDVAWAAWVADHALPPRLPSGDWHCSPRTDNPNLGHYCSLRRVCFDPRMPSGEPETWIAE